MATDPLLHISETFYSIQGESRFAGYPCFFIRLAGCNLRCSYCDARYTYEEPGRPMAMAALLAEAARYPGGLVEITGGEPLLQDNVHPLMEGLLAAGHPVLLETNGSIDLARVPAGVIRIMDIKCPDSGMHDHLHPENLELLTPRDEIKFVIGSRRDYEWAKGMIERHALTAKARLVFSPVISRLVPATLAGMILADRLQVRLQLQLHTILWPERSRGV